jgi:hypothetical protein
MQTGPRPSRYTGCVGSSGCIKVAWRSSQPTSSRSCDAIAPLYDLDSYRAHLTNRLTWGEGSRSWITRNRRRLNGKKSQYNTLDAIEIDMLRVVSANLWASLREKAKHAEQRKGAIAYVTDASLLPLREGDLLVTDASDASIAGGRTSALALKQYFEAGVNLFSLPALHAKILVLDDWAAIGSANASQHSASIYFEAAVLTDRPDVVGQTDKLIQSFAESATLIDEAFIKRVLKIPVIRTPDTVEHQRPRKHVKASWEQRFWLVSLRGEASYPGDADAVENVAHQIQKKVKSKSGVVDWFWWRGTARFREGDVVVECWRPRSKVSTTRSVRVYRHGRIAKIFQEPGVKAKTFHCIWPPDHDDRSVSWSAFQHLARRAGINRTLSFTRTVELTPQQSSALFEIWP